MRLARGRPTTPVWRNEPGGLTFRLGDGDGAQYVKWIAAGTPDAG
jgi:kanamycin kinase